MSRKNNQLRMLANLARKRMLNGNYDENNTITNYSTKKVSNYFIKNAQAMKKLSAKTEFITIKMEDDSQFINKVVGMLKANSEIINPLGILSDNNYLKTLNEAEKQNYILRLSDKYNKIKDAYFNGELKEAN